MGRFLVFIFAMSFIFATPVFAAQPSVVPSITIAASGQQAQGLSIPLSSLSGTGVNGVFSLYGGTGAALTADSFYPLYKNGVAYQVTTGKTAYCFNATLVSSVTNVYFQLLSATASFTFGQSSALTGPVYQAGATTKYVNNSGPTASAQVPIPGTYTFGALTYVGFQAGNSQQFQIHLECYEQ